MKTKCSYNIKHSLMNSLLKGKNMTLQKQNMIQSINQRIEKRDGEKWLGTISLSGWNDSKFKKKQLNKLSEEQLYFLNTLTEQSLEREVNEIMTNIGGDNPAYDLELVVADGDIWIDIEFNKDGNCESGLFTILI